MHTESKNEVCHKCDKIIYQTLFWPEKITLNIHYLALFSHTGMIQFCLTSGNHLVTCCKSELEHPLCRTKLEKKHNQEKINRKDKTSFFTTVRVPVVYHTRLPRKNFPFSFISSILSRQNSTEFQFQKGKFFLGSLVYITWLS